MILTVYKLPGFFHPTADPVGKPSTESDACMLTTRNYSPWSICLFLGIIHLLSPTIWNLHAETFMYISFLQQLLNQNSIVLFLFASLKYTIQNWSLKYKSLFSLHSRLQYLLMAEFAIEIGISGLNGYQSRSPQESEQEIRHTFPHLSHFTA